MYFLTENTRLARAVDTIIGADLSFTEYCRRLIFAFCASVGGLIMLILGVYHVFVDSPVEGIVNLLASIYVIYVLNDLRSKKEGEPMSRSLAIICGALFIYLGTLGDQHQNRVLWLYTYPVMALFMYGRREGILYVGIVFSAWLLFMFAPHSVTGLSYEPSFAYRFVASFCIVTAASWFSESIRAHYAVEMQKRNAELEKERVRLAASESEMRMLAHRDPLTGISNRRCVMNSLHQAFSHARRDDRRVAVALIDIDHFKRVNDTYGHHTGDMVLVGIADRIKRTLRRGDVFGRYGGEEFLLLLSNVDRESAPEVLDAIRSRIASEPIKVGANNIKVTMSIGCSFLRDQASVTALIGAADQAVYEAKASGRNQVVVARPAKLASVVEAGSRPRAKTAELPRSA